MVVFERLVWYVRGWDIWGCGLVVICEMLLCERLGYLENWVSGSL